MRKRWRAVLVLSCLAATLILQVAARTNQEFATWYTQTVYPVVVGTIGRFFGRIPFSVAEMGIYLVVSVVVVYAVRYFGKPLGVKAKRVGIGLLSLLILLFTTNGGINYHSTPFASYANLEIQTYTKAELEWLCEYLLERVNDTVTSERYQENKEVWKSEGIRAMQQLGEQYPALGGFYPMPKEVIASGLLSIQKLCGVYVPFTVEANFNGDMPDYNIPDTICHELSHLKGFMREDEASFIGYLACIGSDNQAFQYSGYLTGWVYAANALAELDSEALERMKEQLNPQTEADLRANQEFWSRYDGGISEAAKLRTDAYLKMNDQQEGIDSYSYMVDLMLAHYRKEQ